MSTDAQLWVEVVGDLIIARVRGEPTAALLRECQERVLFLVKDAGRGKVLYDTLEMSAPPIDIPWVQRELDYRVFYNDMVAAVKWLSEELPAR
jgi:hypothetical protein